MIDKGYDKGPEFLSDHPSLANRVRDAKERAAKLGPDADRFRERPVAGGAAFERLQRRAEEVGRSMPDDKTLEQTQELLQALPRSCLTPAVKEDQKEARRNLQRDLEEAERRQRRRG
jgi:hypothetical protein